MSGTANLTLKQRRKMQGIAMPSARADRSDKKEISKKVALLILFLAFGIGVIAGMIYFRPDQRIADLNQMEALLNAPGNEMPRDVRDMLEGQSSAIRDQLPRRRDDRRGGFSMFAGQFFKLAPADQIAWLKQMEERRAEREQRWAQEQQQAAASGANSQTGNGGNNSNGNGRGGRGGSDAQRTAMREQHLAQIPPQQRGQMTLMRQMGGAVRQQNSK